MFHVNGQTDRRDEANSVFFFTVLQMHLKKTQISVSVWSLLLSKQRPKEFPSNIYVHSRQRRRALKYPCTITVFSLLCIRYQGTEFLNLLSNYQLLKQDSKDGISHL